jgi:hypothetical protein
MITREAFEFALDTDRLDIRYYEFLIGDTVFNWHRCRRAGKTRIFTRDQDRVIIPVAQNQRLGENRPVLAQCGSLHWINDIECSKAGLPGDPDVTLVRCSRQSARSFLALARPSKFWPGNARR